MTPAVLQGLSDGLALLVALTLIGGVFYAVWWLVCSAIGWVEGL